MAQEELRKKQTFRRLLKEARSDGHRLCDLADVLSVSTSSIWRWLQPYGPAPVSTRIDELTLRLNRAGWK